MMMRAATAIKDLKTRVGGSFGVRLVVLPLWLEVGIGAGGGHINKRNSICGAVEARERKM